MKVKQQQRDTPATVFWHSWPHGAEATHEVDLWETPTVQVELPRALRLRDTIPEALFCEPSPDQLSREITAAHRRFAESDDLQLDPIAPARRPAPRQVSAR